MLHYYSYRSQFQEWRTVAQTVSAHAAPGDGIIYCIAPGRLLVDYYTAHQHPAISAQPEPIYPDLPAFNQDPHSLEYLPRWNNDQLLDAASQHTRIWLIIHHDFYPTTEKARDSLKAILSQRYSEVSTSRIDGVTINLYSGHLPTVAAAPGSGEPAVGAHKESR
jgi:hypothetical protein